MSDFVGPLAEIAAGARLLTVKLLGRRRSEQAVHQLVDEISRFANAALAEARGRAPLKRAIACRAACPYCCVRRVEVTAPEVLHIVSYAQQTFSRDHLRPLVQQIVEANARTDGMTQLQRFAARIPCPLLHNRSCSVHGAHPLVCRGYISYSWVACIRDHGTLRLTKNAPLGRRQLEVYGAVQSGLLVGLDDVGLRPQCLELIAALRIAFETPNAAERWLAGEPIFDSALATWTQTAA